MLGRCIWRISGDCWMMEEHLASLIERIQGDRARAYDLNYPYSRRDRHSVP